MPELAYRIVDVFSDRAFAGNGLCVVEGTPGDESAMQRIARAVNLSETTFVTRTAPAAYDVRIFTPVEELPFAGHPTIGSAWTLGPGTWTQRSQGATVTVVVDERGATMTQPDPQLTEVYPEDASRAVGLTVGRAFVAEVGGTRHLLLPVEAPLERVRFRADAALEAVRAVGATGLGVMRPIDAVTVHLRLVVPTEDLTFEDPGTGSAAGPAGLLARRLWGLKAELVIRQGDEIGRPSRMHVHAEGGAVRVGGAVHQFAVGTLSF